MHRFFVPPDWIEDDRVSVIGQQARQMARVLRMQPGDEIIVLDNSGWEIHTRLVSVDRTLVQGQVLRRSLAGAEPRTKIGLYQSVLKANRFELALQKGTELGLVEFTPVIADRCVVSDLEAVDRKRRRWEWILQEAAEQSHRGRLPELQPALLFPQACERARQSGGLSILLWEGKDLPSLNQVLRDAPLGQERSWPPLTISLFVGPEGGFASQEISAAEHYGLLPITLGPRILRAETAGLVAASAILYELGDMG